MGSGAGSLLWLSAATVVGGIASSLGLNLLYRRKARGFIERRSLAMLVGYYLAVTGVVVGGFVWLLRLIQAGEGASDLLDSPWFFLGFGVVMGLPFTLPTATSVWRAPKLAQRVATKRKKATRQQRLEYAQELQSQLQEFGGSERGLRTELQGEKGRTLFIHGAMSRQEGERLVNALKPELMSVDFQRVEGKGDKGTWWVPL